MSYWWTMGTLRSKHKMRSCQWRSNLQLLARICRKPFERMPSWVSRFYQFQSKFDSSKRKHWINSKPEFYEFIYSSIITNNSYFFTQMWIWLRLRNPTILSRLQMPTIMFTMWCRRWVCPCLKSSCRLRMSKGKWILKNLRTISRLNWVYH